MRPPSWSARLSLVVIAACLLGAGAAAGPSPEVRAGPARAPLRFFALGDLPYHSSEVPALRALLARAAAGGAAFIVHVGDLKSGGSRCTDEQLQEVAAIFRAVPVPVVYTPGDNEWTDCHRPSCGGLDPRQRLGRLRSIVYADPSVLRLGELGVIRANRDYPEVYGFLSGDVLVAALHVVGSNNGLKPDGPAERAEFAGREAANRELLKRLLSAPGAGRARALILLIHGNPSFEVGAGPEGYRAFKAGLVSLMGQFPGPVLLIHGDTHRFQHNQPLLDPARGVPFERFTRVEVPGSPVMAGVWITVDPGAAEPFVTRKEFVTSLEYLGH